MAITGGIKIFEPSAASIDNSTTIVASTGDASSDFAIDNNAYTYWRSSGSNDLTTETLTITLPTSQAITRIMLVDHNFKNFQVQYDNSGFTNFSNVTSLDSEGLSAISETNYTKNTSYYEFDSVTTNQIQISIDTTQSVDAEKYLSKVIITTEIGTLSGYPVVSRLFTTRNEKKSQVLSGKTIIEKSIETFRTTLNLNNYPPSYESDIDLMYTLFDRDESFLVWLCGGRFGSDYFRYTLRGFRLQDIYLMQVARSFNNKYDKNIYTGLIDKRVTLEETPL